MGLEVRPRPTQIRLFAGARREIRYVLSFSAVAIIFWLMQFSYQYLILIPGEFGGSLLRSFALSGATLIGVALTIGPLQKLFPKYNFIRHRRSFGVWGFTFIISHFLSVITIIFEFDWLGLFWHANPFANPILFAVGAFPIFVAMWATSTDWAVAKMGFKKWKSLHRLVYLAYISAILHFSQINPELLLNPAGYLLILVTVLALGFEIGAFLRTVRRKGMGKGAAYGFGLVILAGSLFTTAFAFREAVVGDVEPNPRLPVNIAVVRMKEFMTQKGGDPDVETTPIPADQGFAGATVKSGTFERLNYMTTGSVTVEQQGDMLFVVFGEDFSTPNGPELVVYLTRNVDPTTREDVQNGVQLAGLKSTTGKQVYEIPAGVDIDLFNSVTIHCRAFNVPWSYAVLR